MGVNSFMPLRGQFHGAVSTGGTKAKYKYISKPGPKGQKCIACTLFISPAACKIVKGEISPNGYCDAFVAKTK
jgi:hypothetical protein